MPEPKIIYHHNREATIRKNAGINFRTGSGTSVRMHPQPLGLPNALKSFTGVKTPWQGRPTG